MIARVIFVSEMPDAILENDLTWSCRNVWMERSLNRRFSYHRFPGPGLPPGTDQLEALRLEHDVQIKPAKSTEEEEPEENQLIH